MSRSQQGAVGTTAANENTTYNTQAQGSNAAAQGDIGNFANEVAGFKAANPYGTGGPVQTAQNQQVSDAAAGGAEAVGNELQGAAVRTGQNAGGDIAATKDMAEANTRNQMAQESGNTMADAGANAGYQGQVVADAGQTAGMQAKLAATQAGAAQGALGTQEQAAQTPSFMDELGQGAIQAGGAFAGGAGGAMCPAEGSLYLMADESERPVEQLVVGDLIAGIDGETHVIEEIQTALSLILRVETDDGFISRSSRVHAFALPFGGFTVAAHSLGKTIVTAKGRGKVIAVTWDGENVVYNVITGGSHTYRADGIWALGVGEAERQVSMEHWNAIGARVAEGAVIDGGH